MQNIPITLVPCNEVVVLGMPFPSISTLKSSKSISNFKLEFLLTYLLFLRRGCAIFSGSIRTWRWYHHLEGNSIQNRSYKARRNEYWWHGYQSNDRPRQVGTATSSFNTKTKDRSHNIMSLIPPPYSQRILGKGCRRLHWKFLPDRSIINLQHSWRICHLHSGKRLQPYQLLVRFSSILLDGPPINTADATNLLCTT